MNHDRVECRHSLPHIPGMCWGSRERKEVQRVLGLVLWFSWPKHKTGKACLPILSPKLQENRVHPEQISLAPKIEITCTLSVFPIHLQQAKGKGGKKKNLKWQPTWLRVHQELRDAGDGQLHKFSLMLGQGMTRKAVWSFGNKHQNSTKPPTGSVDVPAHTARASLSPSECFQDDSQHRDSLGYSITLCLCFRHHCYDSGEPEAGRVTLQMFEPLGRFLSFLTCHLYRASIRTLTTPSTAKAAFLENCFCLGSSVEERNLHNFQHPTILADNAFFSKEVLGLCLLEKHCCKWHMANIQSQQFHRNCHLLNTDENPAACIP